MCRVFGASYGPTPEDLTPGEIAERLFPAYVTGGPHAYGYMQYQTDDGITYDKWQGRSDTVQAMDRVYYGIKEDVKWWCGHTRWLTTGSATNPNNNHPIPHGKIIGVHNGKIDNYLDVLRKTGREVVNTEVDSEAIFAAVNKWGPRKGLRRIQGKMVAVFADSRNPGIIRIARSHSRTLHVAWSKNGNFFFGTEKQPLQELEIESNIKLIKFSTVSEYRLLTIRDGKIIERGTYLDGLQAAAAQRESIMRQARQRARLQSTTDRLTDYEEWFAEHESNRALRPGEMMFGKDDEMMTTEEYLEFLAAQEDEIEEVEDALRIIDQNR